MSTIAFLDFCCFRCSTLTFCIRSRPRSTRKISSVFVDNLRTRGDFTEPLPHSHSMEHSPSTLTSKPPTPSDPPEVPRLLSRSPRPCERHVDFGTAFRTSHALYHGLYDAVLLFVGAVLRCGAYAVFEPFFCFVVHVWGVGAALRSLLEVALVFGNTLNKVNSACYVTMHCFVIDCIIESSSH